MSADPLTPDTNAVLLLCSTLALPRSGSAPKPLSRSDWNDLARTIAASPLKRPGALFVVSSGALQQELGIPDFLADRVVALLDRGGQLSIELARTCAMIEDAPVTGGCCHKDCCCTMPQVAGATLTSMRSGLRVETTRAPGNASRKSYCQISARSATAALSSSSRLCHNSSCHLR